MLSIMIFVTYFLNLSDKINKRRVMKTNSYNRGMTLIEIAIVLVIIGIMLSIGVSMVGPLTKRAKLIETRETINADVESVTSFAASNRRLPSPIYSGIPPHSEFTDNVRNPNDAWTKPLYYIVDANLTTIPAGTSDAICGRRTTTYTICRDTACTVATNIQNVAFIVASGAENYNLQTGILTGGVCPSGQTCVKVYDGDTANIDDCTTAGNCPNYPVALLINRPEEYDDIVKWVTLDELRTKVGCQGAQLKILNNELPPGFRCNTHNVTISADGGVPYTSGGKYRWCRQESATTGLTFNPATLNTDCLGLAEASWGQADNLTISGSPLSPGTFSLTFFVRDNNDTSASNDNIAQKMLVLTISDQASGFRVWNSTTATRDFMVDGFCRTDVTNTTEITQPANSRLLNAGETIDRYTTAGGGCSSALQQQLTYDDAVAADANCNFQVNYTTSGATDR